MEPRMVRTTNWEQVRTTGMAVLYLPLALVCKVQEGAEMEGSLVLVILLVFLLTAQMHAVSQSTIRICQLVPKVNECNLFMQAHTDVGQQKNLSPRRE